VATSRRVRIMLAGLVSLTVLAGGVATAAPEQSKAGEWQTLADRIYANAAEDYDVLASQGKTMWTFHIAHLAWYAGMRFGWNDQRTRTWLQRVYALRTPSGGYGLNFAYDAYGDGTVNPANTTYTITTAWHVGRMFIDGYDAGAVPREQVVAAVTALLDTPQTAGGKCAAYSKHRNDSTKPCVWNVSAAGAWFLWRAHQRGLYPAGRGDETLAKVRTWRDYVRAHYSTSLGGWNYQEGGPNTLDDPGHLGATVQAMYELDPTIGQPALASYWSHYSGSVSGHELVFYDCSKAPALFDAISGYALTDFGSPEKNFPLAVYAATVERVAKKCGV
jgi:hypothetical protein